MFHLALRLGMTVRQLLDNMDARELAQWKAHFILQDRMDKETTRQADKQQGPSLEANIKAAFGSMPGKRKTKG